MRDEYPSELTPQDRVRVGRWVVVGTLTAITLAIVGIYYLLLSGPTSPPTNRGTGSAQAAESGVEAARQSLTRQTDLETCRGALGQINSELGENPKLSAPALTAEQRDRLRQNAGLSDDELTEIESGNYTTLDGQHLEHCLLFRDAANALEVKGVRGEIGGETVHETALERAERAFAWVVRQVRLREVGGEVVPPAFVLRRGWGSAVERALVFLSLLEQIGDPAAARPELLGCLLSVPDQTGRSPFWACGVVVGDGKDVYLFDPRLGLPLPGPNGKGIATLAQAAKQADVLQQLKADKYRYDVTAEQARSAEGRIYCPLSSLSLRMRHLQEQLLPPVVRIRLAWNPAQALRRLKAAGVGQAPQPGGKSKAAPVEVWKNGIGLLRRFLTPDEGGVDKGEPMPFAELGGFTLPNDPTKTVAPKRQRFLWHLVPWPEFPPLFRNKERFPYSIELGFRVRQLFANPFTASAMEPGKARDQQIRGRYRLAAQELVSERDRLRSQRMVASDLAKLEPKINAWVQEAFREYAAQARTKSPDERKEVEQRIRNLWTEKQAEPVYQLLFHAIAEARLPEITYMLGLNWQEQAEQLQARLDLQTRASKSAPTRRDIERAKNAWQDARSTWKQYLEECPHRRDAAAARILCGRAELMLGDRKAAAAVQRNISGEMTDQEKLAALYRAEQIEKSRTPP